MENTENHMHYQCLIVDDELTIAQTTSEYFNLFELPSAYVTSYDGCLEFLKSNTVSLILLDINLGEQSGFSLCKELREKWDIPIFFISARTSDEDVLTAMNIGGDDFIKKPYTMSILLAKVKAYLKRCQSAAVTKEEPLLLEAGPISIDLYSRKVLVKGQPVKLKEMELKLLTYLLKNRGRVLEKEELLGQVWPDPFVGEGTLSVHIRHLREKVEEDPNHPEYIQTVWGVGYRME